MFIGNFDPRALCPGSRRNLTMIIEKLQSQGVGHRPARLSERLMFILDCRRPSSRPGSRRNRDLITEELLCVAIPAS